MYIILTTCILIVFLVSVYQKKNNAMCKSNKKLLGKTVIVTGGTTGIGLRIAIDMASRGAKVIIACPVEKEGNNAKRIIIQETMNRNVVYKTLDLGSLKSVRNFAEYIIQNEERLDILMNNAGVGVVGDYLTEDGMNVIMQINYYGHFLLTLLLLPLLKKTSTDKEKSRIVNTTSMMRSLGYLDVENYNKIGYWGKISVYSNSKLCTVLFSNALTKRLKNLNIVINDADPGLAATRIYQSYNYIIGLILKCLLNAFFKSPLEGAQTALHVALDEDAGQASGQVYANCQLVGRKISGNVEEAAEKLWEQSLRLVKLENNELINILQ